MDPHGITLADTSHRGPRLALLLRLAAILLAAGLLIASLPAAAAAPALRVGVPYLPPVSRTIEARLYTEDGFEIELAQELARTLGRKVELVRLDSNQATEALSAGRVDLLLSRDAPGEGPAFETGFSSGLSVSMRTDTTIRRWEDLSGRIVCIAEANGEAKRLALHYGAQIREERAPAQSLMKVRTGECDAAIHDEAVLKRLFARKEWQKFSATLPAHSPSTLRAILPATSGLQVEALAQAVAALAAPEAWTRRTERWAANVAFEVYLEQEAPDCH